MNLLFESGHRQLIGFIEEGVIDDQFHAEELGPSRAIVTPRVNRLLHGDDGVGDRVDLSIGVRASLHLHRPIRILKSLSIQNDPR